jgi:hypothetical protein
MNEAIDAVRRTMRISGVVRLIKRILIALLF